MEKTMKKIIMLLLTVALVQKVFAGSPSSGTPAKARTTAVDGNGHWPYVSQPDLGLKVFEVFGTNSAQQLVDESGNTVVAGQLVGVGFGLPVLPSDTAIAFDSSSVNGLTVATQGRAIIPPLYGSATNASFFQPCGNYGCQFNSGLVMLLSNAADRAYFYWRPAGGGKN
jgi:hypothetical protein